MSIAWATVVFLVLLLPGFLFFIGLQTPEQFSRDTTPKSIISQLAGVTLISFFVHTILYWGVCLLAWLGLSPSIDLHLVLSALQVGTDGVRPVGEIAESIRAHYIAVPTYVGAAAGAGFTAGWVAARIAIAGGLGFFLKHTWVYDLVEPRKRRFAATYAYVLTRVGHEGRFVLYKGPLHQFGLRQDGQFAYLLLKEPRRSYLVLDKDAASTTEAILIGTTRTDGDEQVLGATRHLAYLHIEGEDIANVVFESYPMSMPKWRRAEELFNLAGSEEELRKLAEDFGSPWPPEDAPTEETPTEGPFVGTAGGSAFHRAACPTLKNKTPTRAWASRTDALAERTPCGTCAP